MEQEVWKRIKWFGKSNSKAEVSTLGRFRDYANGIEPTYGSYLSTGYLSINVLMSDKSGNMRKTPIPAHRLIAHTFLQNRKSKPCVNHINGVKCDNRLENLEWATHDENTRHSREDLSAIREDLQRQTILRMMHVFAEPPKYGFRLGHGKRRFRDAERFGSGLMDWCYSIGISEDRLFAYACNCRYLFNYILDEYERTIHSNGKATIHPDTITLKGNRK